MIWRNFKMALTSLLQSKMRSFLTMLGIIIGIGSVVAVLAIGEGVKKEITQQVNNIGTNLINVSPGDYSDNQFDFSALSNSSLTEEDLRSVEELDNIEAATALMIMNGQPSLDEQESEGSMVMAATPGFAEVLNQEIESGSGLAEEFDQPETVLGRATADELFPDSDPLGQTVEIRQRDFIVTGVLETYETSFNLGGFDFNQVAYIHLDVGKELNDGNVNISEIDAIATSAEAVDQAVTDIEEAILDNHGGVKDFSVLKQEDAVELFDEIFGLVTSFIAAIAAISLLVGGIGIMNIMLVSVTERTREIGIRKAIGANNRHILTQFLIEAMVLSLLGGLLGIAFAYGLGLIVESQTDITSVITISAIGLAVGVSSAIGLVFGLAPAIKAARKNPIDALRYE